MKKENQMMRMNQVKKNILKRKILYMQIYNMKEKEKQYNIHMEMEFMSMKKESKYKIVIN